MFEIKDLRFAYKHSAPVLKGVDLSLECGEIGVLLGKNGAGKSTLFKCVLGLLKPQGEMLFDLAKEIAKKIEKEMEYPGQIKVNVIREWRATEFAK